MNRLLQSLLAAIGLSTGCTKSEFISPTEFTAEMSEAMRQAKPDLKVVTVRDLELSVTTADGRPSTSFLHNAYDLYRQDPKGKADVIKRFVTAGLESIDTIRDGVDRMRIVPVIKDRPWLEESRQVRLGRGAKELPEQVYEDFNADLVILYAEDSPKNIRYVTPKDLELSKIEREDLRALAKENLMRLIPKIERHGSNGLYMITAGGDYEASLLLMDSIWTDLQNDIQGEVVVAIPTRDLMLVTGSQFPQGLAKMKQMVIDASSKGSYRLTQKLFVHRNGRFEEFREK